MSLEIKSIVNLYPVSVAVAASFLAVARSLRNSIFSFRVVTLTEKKHSTIRSLVKLTKESTSYSQRAKCRWNLSFVQTTCLGKSLIRIKHAIISITYKFRAFEYFYTREKRL